MPQEEEDPEDVISLSAQVSEPHNKEALEQRLKDIILESSASSNLQGM